MKRALKLRHAVLLACLLGAITAVTVTLVPSAGAAGDCSVQALIPATSGGSGAAKANVNCTGSVSWSGEIRFVDSMGNILQANTRSGTGSLSTFTTPSVNCAGKSVHSFMWINVNGVVKSDTSGSTGC